MSNQVTNWNKANQETKTVNESLTIELERYKERVKTFEQRFNVDLNNYEKLIDSQMDDMIRDRNALKQEINSLKQTFSKHVTEKEYLLQTFTTFKNESKEKERKNMDKEIELEKTIKELDNIVYEVGQSALAKDFGKRFVPQPELSIEQAFWLQNSNHNSEQLVVPQIHVKIEAPKELSKVSLVNTSFQKLKYHLANFDKVMKQRTTLDAIPEDLDNGLHDEITKVQMVFNQMEAAVEQCSVDKKCGKLQDGPSLYLKIQALELGSPLLKRPKVTKSIGSSRKSKIVESKISNNSEPNKSWGSNASDVPSSSLVDFRLSKLFSGPEPQLLPPGTLGSGLVLNPPSSTPYVPPINNDWDILFQPMFDEFLNAPPSVVSPVPVVVAQRPPDLTNSPVSTSIDQDAPSSSNPSTQEHEQSLIISQDILGKWTKNHPLANVIGDPSRSVSTRKQLKPDAIWCDFEAFLTPVEPKNFKEAMLESSWIEAMQEEIHEFERLQVWELVPYLDFVMLIKLKWIYKVKKDKLGGVLKNKARLVAKGYHQEEGIDFEESFALVARIEIDSIKNLLDRFSSSKPLSPPIPKYQISVCLLFSKPDVRNGMVKSESVQTQRKFKSECSDDVLKDISKDMKCLMALIKLIQ
ncbi:integrase, catalytic region, zinc finger, CCHC-type containing protein, partial [Tanacetum coccineum]